MALPSFIAFPPANIRKLALPEEWEACLDSWIVLAQGYLVMDRKLFGTAVSNYMSLQWFLLSYAREMSIVNDQTAYLSKIRLLKRQCFLLTHRLFTELDPPPSLLLDWAFLGDFSTIYAKSSSLRPLIDGIWTRCKLEENIQMLKNKNSLLELLEGSKCVITHDMETSIRRVAALLRASSQYGKFLVVGSDFLDAMALAWNSGAEGVRRKLVAITYLSLSSLLEGGKINVSLLLDHLYALKAFCAKLNTTPVYSILSQLVSTTNFVRKLQDRIVGPDAARAKSMILYLEGLKIADRNPKKHVRRKIDKGKMKDREEHDYGAMSEVHVHKMSLITQILDLFPDLGSGFIVKLLDEYRDNAEEVTAHLLDDSLPAYLKGADRTETLYVVSATTLKRFELTYYSRPTHNDQSFSLAPAMSPRPTPPLIPTRKNIFDDDDFDNLAIDTSKLHIGRKNPNLTADDLLSDRSTAPNKAAILSALALFDADDDERDDTYDVEDVGGTVDTAIPGNDEVDADLQDKKEEALFLAYQATPQLFSRDPGTRRSQARIALKSETGMTEEAIEGWAIMLGRDPGRLRRLEAKFSVFKGSQRELTTTAYREGVAESGTDDEDSGGGPSGRGGGDFRGRARGRGRGRGRGDVAGPADERTTQIARQRKDANKGSRANHSRRDQRARKVARAGFSG